MIITENIFLNDWITSELCYYILGFYYPTWGFGLTYVFKVGLIFKSAVKWLCIWEEIYVLPPEFLSSGPTIFIIKLLKRAY
jgi:uncharacterized membrane protein